MKSVHGLKLRDEVFTVDDGRVRWYHTVYGRRRPIARGSALERQHRLVGPIFTITISGSFRGSASHRDAVVTAHARLPYGATRTAGVV